MGRIEPSKLAGASEHSHQVALFAALAEVEYKFKTIAEDSSRSDVERSEAQRNCSVLHWIHAVPNGGARGSDEKGGDRLARIRGGQLKAEGVKSGVSDVDIPAARQGYHGFKIEMKAPGKLKGESDEQKKYGAYLASEGYLYAVFDSWEDAFNAIAWYLGFQANAI